MRIRNSIAYPIVILLLVVASAALTVAYTYSSRHLQEALHAREVDKLKAIKFIVESLVGNEIQRLYTLSGLLKENREITASFMDVERTGQVEELTRTMNRLRRLLHVDIFDALNASGILLLSADQIDESPDAYQDVWGMEEALHGQEIMGTSSGPHGWATRSFIPIGTQGRLLGIVVIGTEIDNEFAQRIAGATNTQISFTSTSKSLASSLPNTQPKLINWHMAKESLLGKRTLFSFEESANKVALYTPLMVLDETMCLILQTSTRDVNELWRRQSHSLAWISLVVLCVVAVLGILLTIYIIRPLKELRRNARAVATELAPGEWHEPQGGDEVQDLLKVFDMLVETIHRYVTERDRAERSLLETQMDLEHRVTARTSELQSANEALQSEIRQREQTETVLKQTLEDLKTLQTQLIQSAKLASIGELASGVAHELNQPLMVIRTTAQLMQKSLAVKGLDADRQRDQMAAIIRNTGRMTKIIDHLRTFSRQTESRFSPVDLSQVMEDVFLMLGEQLRIQGIEIEKNVDDDLPKVLGDAAQLEQVFLNLISNARDAILEADIQARAHGKPKECRKRKIVIQLKEFSAEDYMVGVLIKDTGAGIPTQHLDKVFDPFFTTKEVGKGTGLGLSISYGIIENHAGKIEVAQTGAGGTSIKVQLPAYRDTHLQAENLS